MLKDVQVFRMRNRPLSGASSFRPARAMRAPSGLLLLPPLPTDPANHGTDPDPHGKVRTEQPPRHAGKEPNHGAQSDKGSPPPEGDAQYLQFISPSAGLSPLIPHPTSTMSSTQIGSALPLVACEFPLQFDSRSRRNRPPCGRRMFQRERASFAHWFFVDRREQSF